MTHHVHVQRAWTLQSYRPYNEGYTMILKFTEVSWLRSVMALQYQMYSSKFLYLIYPNPLFKTETPNQLQNTIPDL